MSEENLNIEKVKSLIAEIKGEDPDDKLRGTIEATIKADAEKVKAKAEEDKKLQEEVITAAEEIKKIVPPETDSSGKEPRERDESGKFIKKEPETPEEQEAVEEPIDEEEDEDESKIKELIGQVEEMNKEIEALKKRKNYRMKPPKAEVVEEVHDFIQQNITKNFEVVV